MMEITSNATERTEGIRKGINTMVLQAYQIGFKDGFKYCKTEGQKDVDSEYLRQECEKSVKVGEAIFYNKLQKVCSLGDEYKDKIFRMMRDCDSEGFYKFVSDVVDNNSCIDNELTIGYGDEYEDLFDKKKGVVISIVGKDGDKVYHILWSNGVVGCGKVDWVRKFRKTGNTYTDVEDLYRELKK